jgi:PhnB protein
MAVKPIPDGYTSVAPYLFVDGAIAAIDFYKRAFGAVEHGMMQTPDGKVAHAEIKIGDTVVRLCDPLPMFEAKTPGQLGGTSVELFLWVEDVDGAVRTAEAAGATVKAPPENQFWGDRLARLTDPFGHHWLIASHMEDLSPEEIETRQKAMFAR